MTPAEQRRQDAAFYQSMKRTYLGASLRQSGDADQPPATSGWWLLPAMIAGAGLWAALAWWFPVAAGLLLMVCGVAVMVGA